MKKNLPVTDREVVVSPGTTIISTTDLKGAITSINDDFLRVSGFGADELLGRNHNVVRHPDMPPEAFADLWRTLAQGEPWMGIVKNRTRDGDHYWVDAFVAPVFEGGEVVGYQSVRTAATRERIARAEQIYRRLRARGAAALAARTMSFERRLQWGLAAFVLLFTAGLVMTGVVPLSVPLAAAAAVGLGLSHLTGHLLSRPLTRAAAVARGVVDNPVMQIVYGGSCDEFGQIHTAIQMLKARLRTAIVRVADVSSRLSAAAAEAEAAVGSADRSINRQNEEVERVATAMHQMAATVTEVAQNAQRTADASRSADDSARGGALVASEALGSIDALVQEIGRAAASAQQLGEQSSGINAVLDVIRSIADQTNLLSLNAAIEAARAGEQGRGFAVVAEEVRHLANRSHDAAENTQQMIARLQAGVQQTIAVMRRAQGKAEEGSLRVEQSAESLAAIAGAVATIRDMNRQIATAAEEQRRVAEEISRNLTGIRDEAESARAGATQAAGASRGAAQMAEDLETLVRQCRLAGDRTGNGAASGEVNNTAVPHSTYAPARA